MEISSGKAKYALFVGLRKELDSRTLDLWLANSIIQRNIDERKSQLIVFTKTKSSVRYLMKRALQ